MRINYYLYDCLATKGKIILQENPTYLAKAIKNDTEIANLKKIHVYDGIAMVKFLYWLKLRVKTQNISEISASEYLLKLRKKHKWSENLKDPGIWRDALGRSIQTSGKILGAAVGVGLGVASGIASGDPSNVAKNAAIGGTSGGLLGGSVTGVAADVVDGTTGSKMRRVYNKNRDAYLSRRYGADASKVKKIEKDLAFKKDKNARKLYATEFESELVGLKGKEREEKIDQIMDDAIKYR